MIAISNLKIRLSRVGTRTDRTDNSALETFDKFFLLKAGN